MQITVYPRHFVTRNNTGDGVILSKGDVTVETLMALLHDPKVRSDSWGFERRVLDSALRLFGDFDQWLADNRANPRVVGFAIGFLNDTLQFIETGERQMSPLNWYELLHEGDDVPAADPYQFTPSHLASKTGESTIQVLQRWCAHPNGFEDLISTLHVLFGNARRTLA